MAVRILEHPWAATSLGPIETWPQSLKTVVDVVLANGFAMAALWGRDLIQIYNDAYRELAAENHPGALGRPCREVWPQYWAATSPVIEKVWAGETVTYVDVPFPIARHGKTEEAWFTNCYSPLRDETGAVAGVLFTLLETTERHRTEAALRESESRLQLTLDVAEVGTWDWNLADDTAVLDSRAAQILGLPAGRHASATEAQAACVHPEDLEAGRAQAAAGIKTGEAFTLHYRVVHRDGEIRHVVTRARALPDSAGRPAQVVGTTRDITVEREAELRLRASDERLRTLLQNIRDYAIIMLDANGNITEWTDGATKVIGYTSKNVIGQPFSILYPPEDVQRGVPEAELLTARENGRVEVEGWRVRKDGTRFWANAIVTAIRDERGDVIGFTKISRDLSDQYELLEQREQLLAEATSARAEAEKANRAKDEFLITLSHELRTPLAPILLWARALRAGTVPPHEVSHAVDAIVLSAESQLQLIEDLRDLSRLKSGRVHLDRRGNSVEDIARGALEMIAPSADAKSVVMTLDVPPDLGSAMLDRGRFQQVLWNLLSNSVKFTPEDGKVSLRIRKEAGQLEAVVADTGQGIEADFLPHLFQRFRQADMRERRRYSGLGVGLALCRHLVELHGGTVEGFSEGAGRGAVFTVRIPWIDPTEEPDHDATDAGAAEYAAATLRGLKVLLVEDDDNMRDILRWTLEGAGASVVPVGSGADALSVIDAGDRANTVPDVMVCDLGLPGMNGYELMERVVEHRRSRGKKAIPSCAVSAFVRDVDRERAIDAGFDSYVAKPMTAQRLISAVGELAAVAASDDL